MRDCVFCRIVNGEIPSSKVYEDETVLAFKDIEPQAPVHVIIVPKQHAKDLLEARTMDDALLAHLLRTAANVAMQMGVSETGFRVISNCGEAAGQTVPHLHIHVLGGWRTRKAKDMNNCELNEKTQISG